MLVPTVHNVPVHLPAHSNEDFGAGLHYHIDYRFVENPDSYSCFEVMRPGEVVYVEREMYRETHEVNADQFSIVKYLSEKYKDCKIKDRCPHKGLPILNGRCVGHGICVKSSGFIDTELYISIVQLYKTDIIEISKRALFDSKISLSITAEAALMTHIALWSSAGERLGLCSMGYVSVRKDDTINLSLSDWRKFGDDYKSKV